MDRGGAGPGASPGGGCQLPLRTPGDLIAHAVECERRGRGRGRGWQGGDGPGLADRVGQVLDADHARRVQHHRALDRVAQLADVARPGVAAQRGRGRGGQDGDALAGLRGALPEEVLGEQIDLGRAVAQGGHEDRERADPEEQVWRQLGTGWRSSSRQRWAVAKPRRSPTAAVVAATSTATRCRTLPRS